MEVLNKVRGNKKIYTALTVAIFVMIEFVAGFIVCGRYASVVSHEKADNYHHFETDSITDYKLSGCEAEDGMLISLEDGCSVTIDIDGFVNDLVMKFDPYVTYCDEIAVYYDTGNGFSEKNVEKDLLTSEKSVLNYDIGEDIKAVKIYFEKINENKAGESTLKCEYITVNSLTAEECEEKIYNYIGFSVFPVVILAGFAGYLAKKDKMKEINLLFIAGAMLIVRCKFGEGFVSGISVGAKTVLMMAVCCMEVFLMLFLMKGENKDDEN